MKVICISGKAGHGKDTLASILKEHLEDQGYSVLITHFSDLLKYVCEKFFDWNGEKDETGRTLLQYVGTDVVRKKSPSYWTDFVISILELFPNKWDYVLIPDCRFPNEVECFAKHGIGRILIKIYRPEFVSDLTPEQLNHSSEIAMDNYHPNIYVVNDGTLEDLSVKANGILTYIGGWGS